MKRALAALVCFLLLCACGDPFIHLGPVGVNGNVEPHNDMEHYHDVFQIYGERFARKAAELFA